MHQITAATGTPNRASLEVPIASKAICIYEWPLHSSDPGSSDYATDVLSNGQCANETSV